MEFASRIERVTAMKFIQTGDRLKLLFGAGSVLNGYNIDNLGCVTFWFSEEILHGRVIHGIRQGKGAWNRLAIFGQKAVRLFTIMKLKAEWVVTPDGPIQDFADWILDFLWFHDCETFALITAHNQLIVTDSKRSKIYRCDVNCILYSARLLYNNDSQMVQSVDDIYVAAGTVFNKVIFWGPTGDALAIHNHTQTLDGHKGVIFDVNVNYDCQKLATTSDDRTIMVWSWKSSTGLWPDAVFTLHATLVGHTARVWRSIILDSGLVVSIGEDACIITWTDKGETINCVKAHKGRNIWCMDILSSYLATGGGDAGAKLWKLDSLLTSTTDSQTSQIIPTESANVFPRHVSLQGDSCVQLTSGGKLLISHLRTTGPDRPTCIFADHKFAGYNMMAAACVKNLVYVAVGNTQCNLHLLTLDSGGTALKTLSMDLDCKLMSVHFCVDMEEVYLCTTDTSGKLKLCSLTSELSTVALKYSVTLPLSKQRFPAAVCVINKEALLCADRQHSLHVFRISETSDGSSTGDGTLVETFCKLHGKAGVTDIVTHNGYIYTAGRDGTLKQFSLNHGSLQFITEIKLTKGFDWLGKLVLKPDGGILVAGFQSTDFLLWDCESSQCLLRVSCGGGHRNWDLQLTLTAARFAYIKNKQVRIVTNSMELPCQSLTEGLHGAKVTDGVLFCEDKSAICVTCSDDCSVIVSHFSYTNRELHLLERRSLHGHRSSVKCITSVQNQGFSGSIVFTAGGRAQICAWFVGLSDTDGTLQCRAFASTDITSQSLLTRRQLKMAPPEPDTRIMALSSIVFSHNSKSVLIAACCSDGQIRFVVFDHLRNKYMHLAAHYQHTHCLLVSKIFRHHSADLLCVAGTDGTLLILDLTDLLASLFSPNTVKHDQLPCLTKIVQHQSGVNSLDIRSEEDNVIIYTGGDDNSVVITSLSVTDWTIFYQMRYPQLHSAQITGLVVLDDGTMITSSIDQRLHMWKKKLTEWTVISTQYTTVADLSSFCISGDLVLLTGEGMNILRLTDQFHPIN